MNKRTIILGGLPRSGSTLLANILAQNPRFHATATSGVLGLLNTMKSYFWNSDAIRASEESTLDEKIKNAMRGALNGFYAEVEKPVIFEKARGWEGNLEMAQAIFNERPKVICCVRNVMDVLASFEKLERTTASTRQIKDRQAFPFKMQTLEGRIQLWLQNEGGVVGVPINMIRDAVNRGFKDCLYFCEYERLTSHPAKVIREIYDHIEEEEFKHDYNNVEQVTYENDLVHIYKNLHKIRAKVEPQESTWNKVIPEEIAGRMQLLPEARFWTKL